MLSFLLFALPRDTLKLELDDHLRLKLHIILMHIHAHTAHRC